MHSYNLYSEPKFVVNVDQAMARELVENWSQIALSATGYFVNKNAQNALANTTPAQLGQLLAEGAWRKQFPSGVPGVIGTSFGGPSETNPFIIEILNAVAVPIIPPTAEIAKLIAANDGSVSEEDAENTVSRELNSENIICSLTGSTGTGSGIFCSGELKALRTTNDQSIAVGISEAKRILWQKIIDMQMQRHLAFKNNAGQSQEAQLAGLNAEYLQQITEWYMKAAQDIIRNTLASTLEQQSNDYFTAIKQWGWMMGGTFILRAASDFSRTQEYASSATQGLRPQYELSSLTTGDDLTKLTMNKVQVEQESTQDMLNLKKALGLELLNEDPAHANLFTVARFGRELAGTGLGFLGAGGAATLASGVIGKVGKGAAIVGFILLVAGALVGYVLPAVFAIYGLMGVVSWLTFVGSSFFGVTLWGAAFAAPRGEEHTSQMAGKGWNVLVFIGFYPALAVGGLAAAVTITSIGLPLINMTMSGIWGVMDNGVSGWASPLDNMASLLIGAVIMALLTCLLFWSTCITSASLITTFPRTVLNMISFSEPGLNPYENTSQGIMGGVTGMVKAPLSHATRSVIGRFMGARNPTSPGPGARGA
jgi:hypothetical protein